MPLRTSDGLKLIRGTGRRDRDGRHDPTARLAKAPRPPGHLSPRAAAEWRHLARELVETGVLTGADLRALELLAETLALEADMRAIVAREGATIAGAEGGRKGHPALKIGAEARSQAIRLLEAFGLTPASRQRVDQAPAPRTAENGPYARMQALQAGGGR